MDLRQLRYFISVAEYLNFTEAAKKLFVAQSAVSQQIKELEEKIGVKLFNRSKRNVELTTAGTAFLKEAKSILNKSFEAIEIARQADSGIIGNLTIGFLNGSINQILPEVVREFRRKFPYVNLKLDNFNHRILNEALKNGTLDIGFTTSFGLEHIGGLMTEKVRTEFSSVVLPSTHPLANRTSVNLSELADEPFVILDREESPQAFDHLLLLCANKGFSPKIFNQTKFMDTVLLLVESGLGIGILPSCFQLESRNHLKFIRIDDDHNNFDIVAAWHKENVNPSIANFINELNSILTKQGEEEKKPILL